MPNHSRLKINAILESSTEGRKTCIKDVITFTGVIHEKLVKIEVLQSRRREVAEEGKMSKGYCQYHVEIRGHVIQECTEFRDIVQNLMDKKEIEFSESNDPSINVITGTTCHNGFPLDLELEK